MIYNNQGVAMDGESESLLKSIKNIPVYNGHLWFKYLQLKNKLEDLKENFLLSRFYGKRKKLIAETEKKMIEKYCEIRKSIGRQIIKQSILDKFFEFKNFQNFLKYLNLQIFYTKKEIKKINSLNTLTDAQFENLDFLTGHLELYNELLCILNKGSLDENNN